MPQEPLARLVGEDKFFGQKLHTSADYSTEIRQTDRVHLLAARIVDRQRQTVAERQKNSVEYTDRQRIGVCAKCTAIGRKSQQRDNSASTFDSVINGSYYVITQPKTQLYDNEHDHTPPHSYCGHFMFNGIVISTGAGHHQLAGSPRRFLGC